MPLRCTCARTAGMTCTSPNGPSGCCGRGRIRRFCPSANGERGDDDPVRMPAWHRSPAAVIIGMIAPHLGTQDRVTAMATAVSRQGRQQVPQPPENGARVGVRGPVVFHIPANATTFDGFRAWVKSDEFPDDVRPTFISGEIYLDMSQEELETHVKVKQELVRVLLTIAKEEELGEIYGDGALLRKEAGEVSNGAD